MMDDLDDDPLLSFTDEPLLNYSKSKSLNENVISLKRDFSTKSTLHSDISKLKHKLKSLQQEQQEHGKKYQEENERNLETAHKQYERNVQFIRTRHQENIQVLQNKHEEELQTVINKYEEQVSQVRRQVQELPNLRLSLQSKDEEIQALQEEVKNTKKAYDDKMSKLIQDLEDEKLEEQAEKWDLKKYVDIFKKRCLVLETMLKNMQRTNSDLKDKAKETTKSCDIKIAKAKIDYEARQRAMHDEFDELRQELEKERQQAVRKINKITQKMEEDRVTYEAKILMLSDQIEDQTKTRKYLEGKTVELEEKIMVFRDAVSKIKDQYEITTKEIKIETDLKNKNHREEVEHLVHQLQEVKLLSELKLNEERLQANTKIEELTKILKEQKWTNIRPATSNHAIQTDPWDMEHETVREFTSHLEEIKKKYTEEKSEYENSIARLTAEMDEQKECFVKIIELKQQLEVTSINLETSSESNKKYFKEFIKLKKDFDTSKKHYEIQLRKHHQEIQKYQNANKELTGKYEKLKREYEHQNKTCTSMQKHKQELEEANEGMKTKFGETTKAIDVHMEVLKATIDENKTFYVDTVLQLKHQIEEQMKQNAELEARTQHGIKEAVESERQRLQENFDAVQKERDTLIQELQKQNATITKLNKEIENQIQEVDKIKNDHTSDIAKLRQHYDKEMQHTDDLILILTNDLEHNNKKYNKLKQIKAKTTSQTKTQISNIQKTYQEKICALEKQLEDSNNLLETTKTSLKKEIDQLLLSKELLEKSKIHVQTENERYHSKIEDLTKCCNKLRIEIENISSTYDESLKDKEKTDYESKISKLQATIEANKKEYDEYIKRLKEDIKRGKTYIEQLIGMKENLENKLRNYERKVVILQKYVSDTFMKCNAQLAQELSNDVATFERA